MIKLRRRDVVVVPEVVMHRLEMPEPLAGARVERDQAIAEEIRARPVCAVEIVGRRTGRHVDDPALLVDGELAPAVRAADVLVRVLRPCVVAVLARSRDGMELPDEVAGQHVVRANVAGRRHPCSPGADPRISRFSNTLPWLLDCTRRFQARARGLRACPRRRFGRTSGSTGRSWRRSPADSSRSKTGCGDRVPSALCQ